MRAGGWRAGRSASSGSGPSRNRQWLPSRGTRRARGQTSGFGKSLIYQVPAMILDRVDDPLATLVLIALANHSNGKSKRCTPRVDTLAAEVHHAWPLPCDRKSHYDTAMA